MFIRLMMFVFAAATLLASPFNAHACPDHDAARTTAVLYSPVTSTGPADTSISLKRATPPPRA